MNNAKDILNRAVADIGDRAAERDTEAEKSMPRTVKAFNAMFNKDLTVVQGWQFMELLKMARSVGGNVREDDYRDGAAYAALAGEEALSEQLYSVDVLVEGAKALSEDGCLSNTDIAVKCHGKSCPSK